MKGFNSKIKASKLFKAAVFLLIFINIFSIMPVLHSDTFIPVDKLRQKEELLYSEDGAYSFSDIASHWAREGMLELAYMDILKGDSDKTMKPERTVTRAEFITMLVRALDMPISDTYMKYYKDVSINDWCYYYVSAAKRNGLLELYSQENLEPDRLITREEMAVLAAKALEAVPLTEAPKSFSDIGDDYMYRDSINRVTALGIINGLPDGSFRPTDNATRAQGAQIIKKLLDVKNPYAAHDETAAADFAKAYEERLMTSANSGSYSLADSIASSMGREKNQNYTRSLTLKTLAQRGIVYQRELSDTNAQLISISDSLARVDIGYTLRVKLNEYRYSEYSVTKQLYMKKRGEKWIIYNSLPSFRLITSVGDSEKINLTWQYIGTQTPDMSKVQKINGLNVISPTWFTLTDGYGTIKSTAALSYTTWAHKNNYKVWALVANEFDPARTSKMLASPAARAKAVNALIGYAQQYKIDGINVDFENMYTKDKNAFTQFVKELAQKCKANGIIISADVTIIAANSNWSNCYDRAALAQVVDYIALMTYDQHWVSSPTSGSVAQLSWVDASLREVLKQVPAQKLLLGLPFYTRLWKEEYVAGQTAPKITSVVLSMAQGESTVAANGAAKVWDPVSGQYYATYKKNGAVYKIWLEDERSIGLKSALVNKSGLAGVASWKLGLEKPGVWTTINDTLK